MIWLADSIDVIVLIALLLVGVALVLWLLRP